MSWLSQFIDVLQGGSPDVPPVTDVLGRASGDNEQPPGGDAKFGVPTDDLQPVSFFGNLRGSLTHLLGLAGGVMDLIPGQDLSITVGDSVAGEEQTAFVDAFNPAGSGNDAPVLNDLFIDDIPGLDRNSLGILDRLAGIDPARALELSSGSFREGSVASDSPVDEMPGLFGADPLGLSDSSLSMFSEDSSPLSSMKMSYMGRELEDPYTREADPKYQVKKGLRQTHNIFGGFYV